MKKLTVELSVQQGTTIVQALSDKALEAVRQHGKTPEVLQLVQQVHEISAAMAVGLGVDPNNIGRGASGKSYSLTPGQVALLLVAKHRVNDHENAEEEVRADLLDGINAALDCNDLTPKQAYNLGAALGMLVDSLLAVNPEANKEAKALAAKVNLVELGRQHLREEDGQNDDLDQIAEEVAEIVAGILGQFKR